MTPTRLIAASTAVAAALALSGCVTTTSGRDTGGVPDEEIAQAIADLDGVEATDVEFDDSFGYGSRYSGVIEVTASADAGCVLVRSLGLLKQGRPGVALSSVEVHHGDTTLTINDLASDQLQALNATTAPADGTLRVPVC
ncbi:hypothetical protein [Cellulomonas sp. Y8]|uniref:hypothetical protein n=1 Tax=Cellulomonas sp. Y8 TaxID=2591145 RepID=UPI0011CA6A8E|nr:hypothetical protein [Cellulomonas sp. Y8]